jgi:hypothetical protein
VAKRGKLPRTQVPTAGELFSGYQITAARRVSTGKPSRSAKHALPPAPDATPIPRAPSAQAPTNASALSSRSAALRPRLGGRPAAPGPHCATEQSLIADVLQFPARLLPGLPAPVTFVCEAGICAERSITFVVTTSAADYARAVELGLVALHGAEFAAVTLAAELERVTPQSFEHWLATKQATPSFELTPHVTLGVYLSRHDQRALVVSSVLHAAGARMVAVASASPAPPNLWERCHA